MLHVSLRRIDSEIPLPAHAREGDAGLDLTSSVDVVLAAAGGRALVGTGVAVAIPAGYAGLVVPRSGLAHRHGISVVNAPGLIDSGYRGELMVPLINTDPYEPFTVCRGDRIAQLVIIAVPSVELVVVDELPPSERAEGGFGHTGR